MNKKILILLSSIVCISCANRTNLDELHCIQIIDRNGLSETISCSEKISSFQNIDFEKPQPYQKVLRIFNKNDQGSALSKLTTYHSNGQLWKYLEIKDARAYGQYKEFYSNGKTKIEALVIEGPADFSFQSEWLFDGLSKVYDENGILISLFNYEKGDLQGESKYFYNNAKIKKIIPYQKNQIHGSQLNYSSEGHLLCKANYHMGILDGLTKGFWAKDNLSYFEEYDMGKLMKAQYFHKNRTRIAKIKNSDGEKAIFKDGLLFQLVEYNNGLPEGKVKTFSETEELVSEYFQKNGVKQGEELEYYLNKELSFIHKSKRSAPKLSVGWDNGQIHGQIKTWYKNSTLETQKEYSQNKKNGSHFAWYENGSVMFVEEYENDLLVKGSYYQKNQKGPISTIYKAKGIATLFDSKGRFIKKISYINGKPC